MKQRQSLITIVVSLVVSLIFVVSMQPSTVHAANTYFGIALKNPTHVYKDTSTDSGSWKSYESGSILKYTDYNNNWYRATVKVNGKWERGFIHKNDVENATQNQKELHGVALKNPTHVYANASRKSSLKNYATGAILKYRTFSSNWYEATVYINGKPRKGYIHRQDVDNATENQSSLTGVALRQPTAVYKNASTRSSWKTYAAGSILKYRTFTSNWYEATVYVNGKRQTGYIHKSHVENAIPEKDRETLRGIGTQVPTSVYARASTSAKKLKSYASGSQLKYRTFTSNWYEATVYIKGKPTTGYISKSHVDQLVNSQKRLDGRALKSPTHVYAGASRSSKLLKSYKKHSILKFRELSRNWYEATVYLNGKPHTGYIHKSDVTTEDIVNYTHYNYSFKSMVDAQMIGERAKSDGAGKINATRQEVEYYANPANFPRGTTGFYQFLVLSQPAGLNEKEVNEKILYNKGILRNMAKAFIDAGKKHNINEAYLIAHALHETGNGGSTLANGVPVDANGKVTRDSNGEPARTSRTKHTVYNMYGYGAVDSDPINGGAKYAFDQGWFTPYDAIVGGAASINSYITRGQDTLYKMKWNPVSPGYPQYATHVQWAVLQTNRIAEIYNTLDNYILVFDVPKFNNQPGPSPEPVSASTRMSLNSSQNLLESFEQHEIFKSEDEPIKEDDSTKLVEPETPPVQEDETSNREETEEESEELVEEIGMTIEEVLLRHSPSDESDENIIGQIPAETELEIIEVDGSWFKVIYDELEGWIHSDGITFLEEK
ncbi:SH3 domain-containing protein [Pueribacillus sp. YX66]|uniref:SH3 domain-containing protein n=1 Tax=Pueribacillus sp. YX66 TaxID=3229242 RepID=UPI00358D750E